MFCFFRAILAVFVLCAAIDAGSVNAFDILDNPISVRFRLKDGVKISGKMTEWDKDGFSGSFGKRFWKELDIRDAKLLFHRVMDHESASDWVDYGRMFLLHEDGEKESEAAFRRALQISSDISDLIEDTRKEIEEIKKLIEEEENARKGNQIAIRSPEAKFWPADPWPIATPSEQQVARLAAISDAKKKLEDAGLVIDPIESEFFIVYSDAPRKDAAKWAVKYLDGRYRKIIQTFGLKRTDNIFWGKTAVFIFNDEDQFRLFDAGTFNQFVPRDQFAIAHYTGPQTFIIAAKQDDEVKMEASITREITHVILHRFISPKRLPPWAHEGLAEYFAQQVFDESEMHEGLRSDALELIRGNFPVAEMLELQFEENTWRGRDDRGYPICHLFIDYLIKEANGSFVEWVKACKTGANWKRAFAQEFGGNIAEFVTAFTRFYKVND